MAIAAPVLDARGRVMFHCKTCSRPLNADDFFELGLRLPEPGEIKDEYCADELIDSVTHTACAQAARAV